MAPQTPQAVDLRCLSAAAASTALTFDALSLPAAAVADALDNVAGDASAVLRASALCLACKVVALEALRVSAGPESTFCALCAPIARVDVFWCAVPWWQQSLAAAAYPCKGSRTASSQTRTSRTCSIQEV